MSSSAEELLFGSQSQSISTKQSSAEQMLFGTQTPIEKPLASSAEQMLFGKPEEQTIGSFQGQEPDKTELMRYGWALETNLVGDLWRLGRAALDSEKTIKDIEAERIAKIYEDPEFAKFKDGSFDNNPYVWAGRIGVMATDPIYALMPWARAAQAGNFIGKGGAALFSLGSATGAADAAIRTKARTGSVDWKMVGLGATIGGGATVALGGAGKALPHMFPSLFKNKKIAEAAIESAKGKTVPLLTDGETAILNSVNKSDKVTLAFKNIESSENALFKLLGEKERLASVVTKEVAKVRKIKKGEPSKKPKFETTGDSPGIIVGVNEVNRRALKKANGDLQKAREARRNFLKQWDDEVLQAQNKVTRSHSDYYINVLRELEAKQGLTPKVARLFAYNLTRPLVGGLMGAGAGTLFGADDEDVLVWAGIGAGAGYVTRLLRSGLVTGLPIQTQKAVAKEIQGNYLQQVLRWTNINLSTTTATKLSAHGKVMDEISTLLFPKFMKSPKRDAFGRLLPDEMQPTLGIADNVEDATAQQMTFWIGGIDDVLDGASLPLQREALRLVRGDKTIKASTEAKALASRIKNYVSRFKKYYNDVGIKEKNVYDNFFFRKYNYQNIAKDPEGFRQTLIQIFKNLKNKNPGAAADEFINSINNSRVRDILSPQTLGQTTNLKGKVYLPLTEHIKYDRVLQGDYNKVEKLLMDGGWIVDDVNQVLIDVVQRSVRSVEFARKFGANGEFLSPLLKKLGNQYKERGFKLGQEGTGEKVYGRAHSRELKYLADSINGFFGKYGSSNISPAVRQLTAIASSMANFEMMDKVTLANLGDLVQPFVNSNNYVLGLIPISALQAAPLGIGRIFGGSGTSLFIKGEAGAAKLLDQKLVKSTEEAIRKTYIAGGQGTDAPINSKLIFAESATAQKLNQAFFKLVGLEYVTDLARRFAFNAGAIDAHKSLISLVKTVERGKFSSIDEVVRRKPRAIKHLMDSGVLKVKDGKVINSDELMSLGQFKTADDMLNSDAGKKFLIRAGNHAMNRDAIIPNVGNRLLFAQSRNPLIRMLGQFSSWAMAKTAQTDAMIARIDEGSAPGARQALLMMLSLSLYGGIKDLRDIVTFGHVRNNSPVLDHPDVNWQRWGAEAFQMSGLGGWLGTTFVNQTVGYGSDRPISIAPLLQPGEGAVKAGSAALAGDWEKFYREYYNVLPMPTWRALITRLTGVNLIGATETVEESKPLTNQLFEKTGLSN
jgi:hypothetical protein